METNDQPTTVEADADPDLDEDGNENVEQFALPEALLRAAGVESDEDWDAIPAIPVPNPDPK